MSWVQHAPGSPVCAVPSEVESRRFGLSISRTLVPFGTPAGALDTLRASVQEDPADIVFLRFPVEHVAWFNELEGVGRDLILADTLTFWRLEDARVDQRIRPARVAGVRCVPVNDPDAAAALMTEVFEGYANHYAANPLLDPHAAQVGYEEWMRSLMETMPALGLFDDSGMVAVMAGSVTEGVGEVVIGGIRADRLGRGLYGQLLDAVIDLIREQGANDVVLSTQGHHVSVQRAWARMGFLPIGELVTVHAVRRGLLDGLLSR